MRPRHVPAAVFVVAAIVLLTGCQSTGDREATHAARTAFRELIAQPVELGAAEAVAAQRCLREKGFDAPLPAAATGSVQNLPVRLAEAEAQTRGYGDLIRRGDRVAADPIERYRHRLPPADRARLDQAINDRRAGKAEVVTPSGWKVTAPSGGCVADGRAAVYGSVDRWLVAFYLPQDLNLVAGDAYLRPPVMDAANDYKACMARSGYAVEIPQGAVELAQSWSAADTTRPSDTERALATADARCQAHTKIVDRWLAEFEQGASRWIADNEAAVLEAASIVRASVPRARTILAAA